MACKDKKVSDNVHGYIDIPGYAVQVIDTPQFQRLRNLHQLGVTSYVFPGATHTRFEHSVGVAHLANRMVSRFQQLQPELQITDREVQLVTLAGLCHDLGHGPFSHAFEGWANSGARGGNGDHKWKHENMSARLLEAMVERNELPYTREEVELIKHLISGEVPKAYEERKRTFLFQIVANHRNGIDVDKFDYLARDSFHCSMPKPDYVRLTRASRVLNGEVVYHHKEAFGIGQLFHHRFCMFKAVYCHPVGVAIELMLADILTLAEGPLRIRARMNDVDQYVYLTDAILNEIEVSDLPELGKAKALLQRLRRRDLYKAVGVVSISAACVDAFKKLHHEARVARLAVGVKPEDLVVHINIIDYGKQRDNPLDHVLCFRDWTDTVATPLKVAEVTAVFPNEFREVNVRCYTKDKTKKKAIAQAWDRYCNEMITVEFSGSQNEIELSRQSSVSGTPLSALRTQETEAPLSDGVRKKMRIDFDNINE